MKRSYLCLAALLAATPSGLALATKQYTDRNRARNDA